MTDEQQLTAAGNEMSASFLAAKKRSDETLAKLEAKPSARSVSVSPCRSAASTRTSSSPTTR